MQPLMAPLFTTFSRMAFFGNPQAGEKAAADAFKRVAMMRLCASVAGSSRQIASRLMAAIGVAGGFSRSAAVVPHGIRRPGVDVAFVHAIAIGIEAFAQPLQMQVQRRAQHSLQFRIGRRAPCVDELVEKLRLHVVHAGIQRDAAHAMQPRLIPLKGQMPLRIGLWPRLVGHRDL